MPNTISYEGGATIEPYMVLVDTAEVSASSRTVVHDILDGPPIHTLRPAGQTRGVLHLGFLSDSEAQDALEALKSAAVFRLDSTAIGFNFSFVVAGGDLRARLDQGTARAWIVEVPYQEVTVG